MLTLRQLRYFVVVAEEQSFRRAAAALHMAPPPLLRSIKELEESLGAQLFERLGNKVRLSYAGNIFLKHARAVLKGLDEAARRSKLVSMGLEGTLRIGFHESMVSVPMVVKSLERFRSAYPGIKLELVQLLHASGLDAILKETVDAAFVYDRPAQDANINHTPIATLRWMLALPRTHALARRARIRLRDLQNEEFIWGKRESFPFLYDHLIAACRGGGLTPKVVQYTESGGARLRLAAAGIGICFIVSSRGQRSPGVVIRPVSDLSMPIQLDLIWLGAADSLTVSRLATVVQQQRLKEHRQDRRQAA